MKSITSMIVLLIISIICLSFFYSVAFVEGTYKGKSRSRYTDEPFYGHASVTIKNGIICKVDFTIIDSTNGEVFDSSYEKHFVGNAEYTNQCRNDWKGLKTYPGKLIKARDFSKVNAVSGATWSYNIFKASVEDALKNVKKK